MSRRGRRGRCSGCFRSRFAVVVGPVGPVGRLRGLAGFDCPAGLVGLRFLVVVRGVLLGVVVWGRWGIAAGLVRLCCWRCWHRRE